YGIGSRYLTASIGLCDPELTLTLPPAVTASTGMDALAHALESFVNRATQPISEALAARAMEMIGRSLRRAVFAGDDLRARSEMLLASTMAAMAFNPTRLGDAHALAMPLGASHEIPHSVVIAILLPAVVEFNVVASVEKFAAIARLLGEAVDGGSPRAAAEKAVEAVRRLREDLPIPRGLAEYDVREEHLPRLAEEAMASGNVPVNPRMTTADDLVEIMRRAM
ncbi:MAG: iron-containing alcohol dehydrogenase, partial [Actinomycetota bacterium]|nr:iron-containing alcohol dehydrogenase [Actinomycetota bacterium]